MSEIVSAPSAPTRSRYCFDCGAMFPPGAQFCATCGSPADGSRALATGPTPIVPSAVLPPQQYQQPVHSFDYMRQGAAMRSYTTPALITLGLYFCFWFPGLIANIVYLVSANDDKQKSGVQPQGRGCLVALIAVFVIVPVLGWAGLFGLGVLGGLVGAVSTPTH